MSYPNMPIDRNKPLLGHWSSLSAPATALTMLAFLLTVSSGSPSLIPFGVGAIAAYLLLTVRFWWRKNSARSGMLIVLVSVGILLWQRHQPDFASVLARFTDVFWLLIGIGLLRHVTGTLRIPELLSRRWAQHKSGSLTLSIGMVTSLLTWPMSLGAIPLMIDTLKESVTPRRHMAAIVMRMSCITMVLIPTTIGAAAVFAAMPNISLLATGLMGIPLFLFSLLLLRISPVMPLSRPEYSLNEPVTTTSVINIRLYLLLFWLTLIISLTIIQLNPLQSIAVAAGTLYCAERFRSRSTDVLMPLATITRSMSGEVVLLLASSLLVTLCSQLIPLLPATFSEMMTTLPNWQHYAFILMVLPLFSVVGVHPLLLFSAAFPALSPYMHQGAADYLIWICLFIAAQLLSPISINAVLAATSLHISPIETSFKMHIRYVLLFNAFAFIYLSFIANNL